MSMQINAIMNLDQVAELLSGKKVLVQALRGSTTLAIILGEQTSTALKTRVAVKPSERQLRLF